MKNIEFIEYYGKKLTAHKKHLELERLKHPAIVIAKLCGVSASKIRVIVSGGSCSPQVQKLLDMVISGDLK
jgi:hypothetical protein